MFRRAATAARGRPRHRGRRSRLAIPTSGRVRPALHARRRGGHARRGAAVFETGSAFGPRAPPASPPRAPRAPRHPPPSPPGTPAARVTARAPRRAPRAPAEAPAPRTAPPPEAVSAIGGAAPWMTRPTTSRPRRRRSRSGPETPRARGTRASAERGFVGSPRRPGPPTSRASRRSCPALIPVGSGFGGSGSGTPSPPAACGARGCPPPRRVGPGARGGKSTPPSPEPPRSSRGCGPGGEDATGAPPR